MSLGSVRLASMGPRVGWVTLALCLEVALPATLVALATHPTTLALVGQGAGRVRSEGEALRRRRAERASREAATASLISEKEGAGSSPQRDEAWAEPGEKAESESAEPEDTDEAWAEREEDVPLGSAKDADEAWAEPADKDDEGDADDPEAKGTKGEGLN